MSTNHGSKPDYDALLEVLVEKTKAGKLDWQQTASEGTFIAAVKGQKTFRVTEIANGESIVLEMVDTDGQLQLDNIFESPAAKELHSLARHIALRFDENIDAAVQLLDSL